MAAISAQAMIHLTVCQFVDLYPKPYPLSFNTNGLLLLCFQQGTAQGPNKMKNAHEMILRPTVMLQASNTQSLCQGLARPFQLWQHSLLAVFSSGFQLRSEWMPTSLHIACFLWGSSTPPHSCSATQCTCILQYPSSRCSRRSHLSLRWLGCSWHRWRCVAAFILSLP